MSATDAMIRLEGLQKQFPGQTDPAVRNLDLEIPRGEIVVLVGPSGCGKTTILRLINRLIEPTAGRIVLDGEDVTDANPDVLRRRIGYVIQQIGLFPHLTIAENIATVPRVLGWERQRIDKRVDELLETVGMDAAEYRDRYPRELSGGQGQRVGVARAMAADPPVLLLDEPFGAIDPITRERLQDEFLRIQEDLAKTVVFVTHDIGEAVKMGDRIALLREGGEVAQYDPPEHLLTAPADSFVEDFIGTGSLVRGLALTRVGESRLSRWPTVELTAGAEAARESLQGSGRQTLLVLDDGRPVRWVGAEDLADSRPLDGAGRPVTSVLTPDLSLHEALDELIGSAVGAAAVVDEDGSYRGVVELETLTAAVAAMRSQGGSAGD